ncbi:FAD-dependent oxidoreductase [Actinotalea solisilvae]|uniref:FAD-dependent oxidoreductase n=1 Tax=Actinotalea solisilvae TaxID=2072922 RepID=UPI0018F21F85|nr:FAD-dependent oxidoreductase [Actinotalea solisilvae]
MTPSRPARTRSVAVVGGGIAGLATALALGRDGWSVTVHERAPGLTALGAGLVLGPNAVRALDALGLRAAVRERAFALTGSAVLRPDGRALSRLAASRLAERHGAPVLAVERSALHALLADAVGPGVVRCGSDIADATSLAGDHDLVVAADGIRSRTRATAWPDAAAPSYAGYTAWRAVVHTDTGLTEASETWGHRERFGVVPVGDDAVYVFATATVPAGRHAHDGATELAELRRRFGAWHAPLPALLDAVDPTTVLRHDVDALPRVPASFHRGRTVLVGDAAHAMEPNLGQGAGLALEDAVVLAHVLADGGRVEDALARFTALRRPRASSLVALSARLGRLTQGGGRATGAARDAVVRLTPAGLALRGSDRVMGWRPPRGAAAEARVGA